MDPQAETVSPASPTVGKAAAMSIVHIPGNTPEEIEQYWYREVYQGDDMPQLTLRAILMGAVIGFVMCLSNLYVGLKTGWGLGVVVTAVILSYSINSALAKVLPGIFGTRMSILENNAMASTASSAGYSTGGTMVSATAAYLIVTGHHIGWHVLILWTFFLSGLGVFFAIPMKRQMVNVEQLKFPTGLAAAETLRSLYATGSEAKGKARALGIAGALGALVAWWRDGMSSIAKVAKIALPGHTELPGTIGGIPLTKLTISMENSLIMVGAGAIMGMRTTLTMFFGSLVCFGYLAPKMYHLGVIKDLGYRGIVSWSLWAGVSVMVTASLLQFAMQGKSIARAFSGLSAIVGRGKKRAVDDPLARIEVPSSWFATGFVILSLGTILTARWGFGIPMHYGALAVLLSFILCIVACRVTGETDTTPVGPLGKITQLTYGVLIPQNMTANLMTASITGNTATSAADLLTDLKSGYLLGANPRKQFFAQFIGCFVGTAVIVPFFYILVPHASDLGGDRFPAPAAQVWAGVAKLLSVGLHALHPSARWGMAIGGGVGLLIPILEALLPPKARKFVPSASGLGLSFVIPAFNSFSMFLGALGAWIFEKVNAKKADRYVIPISAGLIAGESIMGVAVALLTVLNVLH